MKIIKMGEIPNQEKEKTCKNCKTVLSYEPKDVLYEPDRSESYPYINCPVCKKPIYL